jgi:hypothetical protein
VLLKTAEKRGLACPDVHREEEGRKKLQPRIAPIFTELKTKSLNRQDAKYAK